MDMILLLVLGVLGSVGSVALLVMLVLAVRGSNRTPSASAPETPAPRPLPATLAYGVSPEPAASTQPYVPASVGNRVGGYVLLEPIGMGGMGQVYRARQSVLDRDCALKIIRKDRLQSSEAIERFLREARAAARLKHPNIVTIYDAGVADGVHYLAMELLHGATLADLVKRHGPLPIGAACRYLRQAAVGLQHACDQGLVHRDLKPHNLFLEQATDQVKVLDLGLARMREVPADGATVSEGLTREGEVMGTPDYMAPEQALDTRSADQRADIYSLGCTLYFLIAGQPPFPGGSLTEKLLAHQQKEPPPLDRFCTGVPAGLVEVVRKALAKQPADRYQTPAELAAALAPFENAHDIVAAPVHVYPTAAPAASTQRPASHAPSVNVAKPSAPDRSPWLIVLVGLTLASCCVLAPIGLVAMLVIAPVGHQQHRGEGPMKHEEHEDVKPAQPEAPAPRIKEVNRFEGQSFRVSNNGKLILHGSGTKYHMSNLDGVRIFSLNEGDVPQGFADSDFLILATAFGKTLHLYDVLGRKQLRVLPLPLEGEFRACVPRADGKSAVILSDHQLAVIELEKGKTLHQIKFKNGPMEQLALSRSNLFALTANAKSQVFLWSLAEQKLDQELAGFNGKVHAIALSDDVRFAAAAAGKNLFVWQDKAPAEGGNGMIWHPAEITSVAIAPDGKRFVTGGRDRSLRVGDFKSFTIVPHDQPVLQVAFHPDGQRVISASQDNTVRVWQLPR